MYEPHVKRTLQLPYAGGGSQEHILGISVECGIDPSEPSSSQYGNVQWHASCVDEEFENVDVEADNTGRQRVVLELTLDVRPDNVSLRSLKHDGQDINHLNYKTESLSTSYDQRRIRASPSRSPGSKSLQEQMRKESEKMRYYDYEAPSPAREVAPVLSKSKSRTGQALEGLRFISRTTEGRDPQELWREVEARFQRLANPASCLLSRSDFAACIGMKESKEFAVELLDGLTRRRFGIDKVKWISKEDLSKYWAQISDRSFHARTQIFFDLCDKDSDGRIAEKEVKEVILLSASANKLSMMREQAEEYAALIMEELDQDNKGYIELSQLEALFQEGFESNDSRSQTLNMHNGFLSGVHYYNWGGPMCHLFEKLNFHLQSQWQRWWVLSLWLATMLALFTWKFVQYKNRSSFQVMGYCVCIAKGAAETLKLNMALVLLPVCRNTITWFRSTFLGNVFPFDDSLNLHKLIAGAIVLAVIVHGGVHLACDFPRIANANPFLFYATLGQDFGFQQPSYGEIVSTSEVMTGILMVFLMAIAYLLATRSSRRNIIKLPWPMHRFTGFNAFWYSHHLFILVYALLIIHSLFLFLTHDWLQKTTWMYITIPIILYCGERTLRAIRATQYKVDVINAAIYPGEVLALYMAKPLRFSYFSGMYIFLQCPNVSPFEWHPFTITSAPGDEFLSVHVRDSGDWTRDLIHMFSQASIKKGATHSFSKRYPRLLIDGPYGAPAQEYKKYNVMLLVGLGIGATPFISILRDILHDWKIEEKERKNSDTFSASSSIGGSPMRTTSPLYTGSPLSTGSPLLIGSPFLNNAPSPTTKKRSRNKKNVYFYWVTREQSSFEWFKEVMNEVAENDQKAIIEMHNHLTSVYEEGDARSALITMVQALQHAKSGMDIVSGTRVRTHFARPNWKKVFARLAARHPFETIGVFYCGPARLTKELDSLSQKFTQKSKTKFIFHKENF
ncbi:hypothetical protein L7F22_058288 [Adiantum nelumboides]|nr:hypothetical protein [Adiantum nelumboides]